MRWLLTLLFSVHCAWIYSGQSHQRNYLVGFYDEFLRQQKQYMAAAGLSDAPPTGYVPVTITNNSSAFVDTDIYIFVTANNNSNIVTFSNVEGQMLGSLTTPPAQTYVSQVSEAGPSYPLHSFLNSGGSYVFYLPATVTMQSSRIYFSMGQPLDWFINNSSTLLVQPTDFCDLSLDNYYTLYDKIEFTMLANNALTINSTLVDYYGLPLSFSVTTNAGSQYSGLPPSLSSSTIFSNYTTAAAALPSSPSPEPGPSYYWTGLALSYTPPSGSSGLLRILSPGSALLGPSQFVNIPAFSFPSNYYLASNTFVFCNWFTTVWQDVTNTALYQGGNTLYIDLSVAGPGSGVASGTVDNFGNFNFTGVSGAALSSGFTMTLPLPTTSLPFFTGSLNNYPGYTTNNATYATVLWEIFSSAVLAGILPITGTSITNPLSEATMRASGALFQPNINLSCTTSPTTNPPYYDFYSQTMLGMGSGNYTKYYTFPYSDVWATDGTITIDDVTTVGTTIAINIGDMTGIAVPDPFNDTFTYTVVFNPLPAGADGASVTFGSNPDFISNPSVPSGGTTYLNVTGGSMYMGVTYSSGPYAGKVWGTHIVPSINPPALKPVLPGTALLTSSAVGGTVTITVGGSPSS